MRDSPNASIGSISTHLTVEFQPYDWGLLLPSALIAMAFSRRDRVSSWSSVAEPYESTPSPRICLSGYGRLMLADFTVTDQEGEPWRLSDHLDAAVMLVYNRGDW